MVDEKIFNTLSDTVSSQRCFICGATPSDMNIIDNSQVERAKREQYGFGLSTLHAWIRLLECLLHIGWKLSSGK